ncbi:hypothetical protein JOD17_004053 [Geomicrobium sediminis]|uniref:Uncharacterized protein n=1 Tax=Geomicrobium sediminis TaxID=1347788 RepID=A0ABS2PIZ3_9BACL|nr:hypothetical protein [Geomicrobium sediminis]
MNLTIFVVAILVGVLGIGYGVFSIFKELGYSNRN